mmetsp:Transcript_34552/g.87362  ORF Transcript_34552/g.87362 Transcript_34552/m.87362 type:complete len:214 (+) Transcript_34552:2872-3513(+)
MISSAVALSSGVVMGCTPGSSCQATTATAGLPAASASGGDPRGGSATRASITVPTGPSLGAMSTTCAARSGTGPRPCSYASSAALGGSAIMTLLKRSGCTPSAAACALTAVLAARTSSADRGSRGCRKPGRVAAGDGCGAAAAAARPPKGSLSAETTSAARGSFTGTTSAIASVPIHWTGATTEPLEEDMFCLCQCAHRSQVVEERSGRVLGW